MPTSVTRKTGTVLASRQDQMRLIDGLNSGPYDSESPVSFGSLDNLIPLRRT